jgi:alpha-amylase
MGEWALPSDEALVFHDLRERAVAEGRPEARWLRGGFWRNFQVKYREVNDLHKQMLRTSAKVAAMPDGSGRERALDHLYRGQSNDCYWHGLFGGIYISHMRLATFEHLIAAEDLADTLAGAPRSASLVDTDLDGLEDVLISHPGQVVGVDLAEGAGIGSWDIRAARHALTAVLRRRPEWYHERLRRHEAELVRTAAPEGAGGGAGKPVASIHEIVQVKEPGLAARLHMDGHERRSGLVRFLPPGASEASWAEGRAEELGDALDGRWIVTSIDEAGVVVEHDGIVRTAAGSRDVRLEKRLSLGGDRRSPTLALKVVVENRSSGSLDARLGIEWAITMLGGGGNPAAWWQVAGRRTAHDGSGTAIAIDRLAQGNDHIGIEVRTTVEPAAEAWWAPIETISNSEAGFERVYQGGSLLLSWPLSLGPGERVAVSTDHRVTTGRDHAEDESGGVAPA